MGDGNSVVVSSSTSRTAVPPTASAASSTDSLWKRAAVSAFRGGLSGSIAMVLQVFLLMWLHTAVNYQYKTGVGIREAFSTLYREGGIWRFYNGVWMALLIAPISRFGDTASNEGITDLFASFDRNIPVWVVTLVASFVAAVWRILITPIDTIKTTLQVADGANGSGWDQLLSKIHTYGIWVLWDGAFGNWLASIAGYYPWYAVNNWLELRIPAPTLPEHDVVVDVEEESLDEIIASDEQERQRKIVTKRYQRHKVIRRAFIGLCASFVSTSISNGIRVVKTYGQTSEVPLSYLDALKELFHDTGLAFLYRGLELKLMTNCLQGVVFSILWKMLMDQMKEKEQERHGGNDDDPPQDNVNDDVDNNNQIVGDERSDSNKSYGSNNNSIGKGDGFEDEIDNTLEDETSNLLQERIV